MAETSGARRQGRQMRGLLQLLRDHPEGLPAGEAINALRDRLQPLLPEERGTYKSGGDKFPKLIRFGTITIKRAGWLVKSDGVWSITDAGVEALIAHADEAVFFHAAQALYNEWKETTTQDPTAVPAPESDETVTSATSLEEDEDAARSEVIAHLGKMPPFDFQAACAALVGALVS